MKGFRVSDRLRFSALALVLGLKPTVFFLVTRLCAGCIVHRAITCLIVCSEFQEMTCLIYVWFYCVISRHNVLFLHVTDRLSSGTLCTKVLFTYSLAAPAFSVQFSFVRRA